MAIIVIDLGTTNSLASYWHQNHPALIPNVFGSYLTPSVVSVDDNGHILIGQPAKERLVSHPLMTAAAFKRFMGTEKYYTLGPHSFSCIELSSLILQSLKNDAEVFLGEPVEEALISVPAYFNEHQRQATMTAAKLSGLKVQRLITEPTAAAIAYGLHQRDQDTVFAVLDLGGGTFDISILEMFEGIMEVRAIAGDVFLGGEDFTELLCTYMASQLKVDRSRLSPAQKGQLYKQAELCKRALTDQDAYEAEMTLEDQLLRVTITRDHFERIAETLLMKMRAPTLRALRDAKLNISSVDAVVLIGGATRMPMIRAFGSKIFNKLPFTHIHPDEAVALGIAVQIALRIRHSEVGEMVLTDVCPFTLGTAVNSDSDELSEGISVYSPIIERNTTIPCSREKEFVTARDNQTKVEIEIYQGESLNLDSNLKLGAFKIKIPPNKAGRERIGIRFTYDSNGLLEVEATVRSTGEKTARLIEKTPGTMTSTEIEESLSRIAHLKIHPREQQENQLILARANRLYEEFIGAERAYVGRYIMAFQNALQSQDSKRIKQAQAEILDLFESTEGWFDLS